MIWLSFFAPFSVPLHTSIYIFRGHLLLSVDIILCLRQVLPPASSSVLFNTASPSIRNTTNKNNNNIPGHHLAVEGSEQPIHKHHGRCHAQLSPLSTFFVAVGNRQSSSIREKMEQHLLPAQRKKYNKEYNSKSF